MVKLYFSNWVLCFYLFQEKKATKGTGRGTDALGNITSILLYPYAVDFDLP